MVTDFGTNRNHVCDFLLVNNTMGAAGFFPGVGNEGVWRTEVPQRGPGAAPRWRSGAKLPKADDIFSTKMMHKYFIYWGFRQHLQQKNTFQHFQRGGGASFPLACTCGHSWIVLTYILSRSIFQFPLNKGQIIALDKGVPVPLVNALVLGNFCEYHHKPYISINYILRTTYLLQTVWLYL